MQMHTLTAFAAITLVMLAGCNSRVDREERERVAMNQQHAEQAAKRKERKEIILTSLKRGDRAVMLVGSGSKELVRYDAQTGLVSECAVVHGEKLEYVGRDSNQVLARIHTARNAKESNDGLLCKDRDLVLIHEQEFAESRQTYIDREENDKLRAKEIAEDNARSSGIARRILGEQK